jgi:hypothetical protein
MGKFRIKRPRLSRHVSALGHICIEWAHLEGTIDALLAALIPLPLDNFSRSITTNADVRAKIQMVKGLALARKIEWYDDLAKIIDLVDNTLRPTRNRYVHDTWVSLRVGHPRQVQWAMKIKKPQARQPSELTTMHVNARKLEEMWDFIQRVAISRAWLWSAAAAHSQGKSPPSPPPGLFE